MIIPKFLTITVILTLSLSAGPTNLTTMDDDPNTAQFTEWTRDPANPSSSTTISLSITNLFWELSHTQSFQLSLSTNIQTNWFSFHTFTNKPPNPKSTPQTFLVQLGRISTNRYLTITHRSTTNSIILDQLGTHPSFATFRTNRIK